MTHGLFGFLLGARDTERASGSLSRHVRSPRDCRTFYSAHHRLHSNWVHNCGASRRQQCGFWQCIISQLSLHFLSSRTVLTVFRIYAGSMPDRRRLPVVSPEASTARHWSVSPRCTHLEILQHVLGRSLWSPARRDTAGCLEIACRGLKRSNRRQAQVFHAGLTWQNASGH